MNCVIVQTIPDLTVHEKLWQTWPNWLKTLNELRFKGCREWTFGMNATRWWMDSFRSTRHVTAPVGRSRVRAFQISHLVTLQNQISLPVSLEKEMLPVKVSCLVTLKWSEPLSSHSQKCLIIGYSHTAVMPAIRVGSNGFPAVTAVLCKLHNKMMKNLCAAVVIFYGTMMDPACLHELVSSQDGRQLARFERKQLGIKASTLTLCVETRFQPKHSLRVYSHSGLIYLAWKTMTPSLRSPLSPSFFILLFASLLSFLPPVHTHFF